MNRRARAFSTQITPVQCVITAVLKDRPLASRWRDTIYPASYTPFYLYGTDAEQHIDHMLLRAPNAQIAADRVTLNVEPALPAEQLARGAIVRVNRPEASLQPLSDNNIFVPGASFKVTVYSDAHDADAHGPGLAEGGEVLATGTLTLSGSVLVDTKRLNQEEFVAVLAEGEGLRAFNAPEAVAAGGWSELVKERLGLLPAGGQALAPPSSDSA